MPSSHTRLKTSVVCLFTGLSAGWTASAMALNLADKPLFLADGSIPNVILMLDDSGSMDWEILTGRHYSYCAYATTFSCPTPTTNGLYYPYWSEYRYLYNSSANVYSGNSGRAVADFWSLTSRTDFVDNGSADWRIFSKDFNVLYYDPNQTYSPWISLLGNASFTAARAHPVLGESGYSLTRDLTGSFYVVYQDTAGFTGSSPTNSASSYSSGANGLVDYWDDHTIYQIDAAIVTSWDVTFSTSGGNIVRTVSSPTIISDATEVSKIQQNYANWYQYSRRRAFATNGAVSNLLDSNPDYRYSLGLINRPAIIKKAPEDNSNLATHNSSVLTTLFQQDQLTSSTPLREGLKLAGQYLQQTTSAPITESCQQNFTVLFTDGFWSNTAFYDVGNTDGDPYANTVADVAAYYYLNDLRPDMADNVPTSAVDSQSQQHMNTFTVAFGVDGALSDTDNSGWPDSNGVDLNASSDWGNPFFSNSSKIDDLWHASFNSRGLFTSARTPAQVSEGLSSALAEISRRTGSSASVATNSGSLRNNSLLYQARFNSGDWIGDLWALGLSSTGEVNTTAQWQAATLLDNRTADNRVIITADPNADNKLVGVAFRHTGSGSELSDAFAVGMDALGIAGSQSAYKTALVNYIRGDESDANSNAPAASWTNCASEGGTCNVSGTRTVRFGSGSSWDTLLVTDAVACTAASFANPPTGSNRVCEYAQTTNYGFRTRPSKLGDFIHSDPVYVGPPIGRYQDNDYQTFRTNQASRTPVVYVGGNDGMLHGFRASDGHEVLAFVPHTLAGDLYQLADPNYNHRYFVDGGQTVADVCTSAGAGNCSWKTMLAGSLRGGGKGIYALDITDPSSFSEQNAANLFVWEFNDQSTNGEDMGYSFGKPLLAKAANGQWVAIVANGYNSANGKAVLYILNAATGAVIKTIDTQSGTVASANGLSSPTAIDLNEDSDGDVDYIYAGDLKGNLWKFDLSSANPTDWDVAYQDGSLPLPLFTAGDSSPITVAPAVGRHPSEAGYMVYFGTGKYLETVDNQSTGQPVQGFYGVWDENLAKADFTRSLVAADLLTQTIESELVLYNADTNGDGLRDTQDSPTTLRVTSANPICWRDCGNGVAPHKGWVLELQLNGNSRGEKQVTRPLLRNGRIIFTTLLPSSSSCTNGGQSWLMELSAVDGSPLSEPPFDLNSDGEFDQDDRDFTNWSTANLNSICPSGLCPSPAGLLAEGIVQVPSIITCSAGVECKYLSGSSATVTKVDENPGTQTLGRQSWRELREE